MLIWLLILHIFCLDHSQLVIAKWQLFVQLCLFAILRIEGNSFVHKLRVIAAVKLSLNATYARQCLN